MIDFIFRPIALLPFFSAISILITIIFYLTKSKKTALLFSFLALQVIVFLWPFGQAIQYCAADNQTVLITVYLIHTSINFLGLVWLLFAMHFTSVDSSVNYRKIFPLFIMPFLFYIVFLTNQYHHLYFKEIGYDSRIVIMVKYGWLFWFGVLINYGYTIAGIIMLMKYAYKQAGLAKSQSLILASAPMASFLVSFFCNIYIIVANMSAPKFFDFTSTCFTISMLMFSVATFRYRFLNINPGAFKRTFENLHDSILVVDNYNCIANLNDSFVDNFGNYSSNDKVNSFVNRLQNIMIKNQESEKILAAIENGIDKPVAVGKLVLTEPFNKTYEVIIQTLDYQKKAYRGRIITFHEITEYNSLLEELHRKNEELFNNNQKLNEHLRIVEELAVANERNRVSREIHDTLGHSLTLLIMLMKAAKIKVVKNPTEAKEQLTEGIKVAQTKLNELRASIGGLLANDISDMNIFDSISSLGHYMENLGIHIEFTAIGKEIYTKMISSIFKFKLSDAIYKISMEAITNSLRHGNATVINIIVKFSPIKVNLFIIDNGSGCRQIIKGFGLIGMEERVNELKGKIKYGSDGESGFNIHVELPMENVNKQLIDQIRNN